MALKAILDSLDSVDAALHDHYTEKDGKYVLQIEGVQEHPDTKALKSALDRVRKEKKDLADAHAAEMARFAGLPDDFDSDAYETLRAAAEGKDPPKTDEQVVRVRDQLERKHASEMAKKDEALAKLHRTIERLTIDEGLSRAMDEANIDPRHKKKLAPYLKATGKIKLDETDDGFEASVETDLGPVSLSKFVSDWAGSDDGKEYVGKPAGLDTKGSDGRRSEGNPFTKAAWNKTEQGAMMRSDRAKAERMAKAAGFKSLEAAAAAREPIPA